MYERQGAVEQAKSTCVSAIEVINGVAGRLQDQEIKRVFLSSRPVLEIQERLQKNN